MVVVVVGGGWGGMPIITLPPSRLPCWVSTRSFWCTTQEQEQEEEDEEEGLPELNTLCTAERRSDVIQDKRSTKGEKL